MVSMENNNIDQASSYSWWWDSHNRPNQSQSQSQWLQATLSDLDKKTKVMLNLVQEDGDSFAKRAEMYYKKRPELLKMVEDFHRSYRSLAEKYDQLRSESIQAAHSGSLSISNSKQIQHLQNCDKGHSKSTKPEAPNSHPESVVEDPDLESETSNFDFESLNRLVDELMSTDPSKNSKIKLENDGNFNKGGIDKKINDIEFDDKKGDDFLMGSLDREKMWNELRLKVPKLIEDNLRQQAELIRRNDEKREAIKDLCSQIDRLMDENKALKRCRPSNKVDKKQNQSKISRLKALVLRKFLG